MRYVASLIAKDWSFWCTVTANLKGLRKATLDMSALQEAEKTGIASEIDLLLVVMESRSSGWKMPVIVGPRKRWYDLVETSQTVGEFGIW